MENFKEKELQIANEKRDALRVNHERYEKRRLTFDKLLLEAADNFNKGRNELSARLRELLAERAEMKRQGLTNFAAEMQDSYRRENEIHETQRELHAKYAEAKQTANEAKSEAYQLYLNESYKIKIAATDKLNALLAELEQSKAESESNLKEVESTI